MDSAIGLILIYLLIGLLTPYVYCIVTFGSTIVDSPFIQDTVDRLLCAIRIPSNPKMNADTVLIYLDRARYYALDAVSTISQCLCKPDATLKISGRTYKVERLLGEGGTLVGMTR
jgi:hypothetical protein